MAVRLGGRKAKLAGHDFRAPAEAVSGKTLEGGGAEQSTEELAAEEQDRWFDTSRE